MSESFKNSKNKFPMLRKVSPTKKIGFRWVGKALYKKNLFSDPSESQKTEKESFPICRKGKTAYFQGFKTLCIQRSTPLLGGVGGG